MRQQFEIYAAEWQKRKRGTVGGATSFLGNVRFLGSNLFLMQHPFPQNKICRFLDAFLQRYLRRSDHFGDPKSDQIVRFLDTLLKRCLRRYGHFDCPKSERNRVVTKTTTMGSGSRRTPNRPLFGRPFEVLLEAIRPF